MLDSCGEFKGMKVELAKNQIKKKLLDDGKAELFYELTGEVMCCKDCFRSMVYGL